ncbi:MAG: TlpA disulfide reductase family protein [Gammaproteobacteria bacterium]|nr:TlpA disulfide reductase family protein [Gammaproteobacteria bacterium]
MTQVLCKLVGRNLTAVMLLLLSILCLFSQVVTAGELSKVSAIQPPQFKLQDLAGNSHSLDEFTGKVILVNFWASWCIPCIEEIPTIKNLAKVMSDDAFVVIGINNDETLPRVQATVKRLDMDFLVLLDRHSEVFTDWGADILPTAFVLDRSGQIRYMARGPIEWDSTEVIQLFKRLVAEPLSTDK